MTSSKRMGSTRTRPRIIAVILATVALGTLTTPAWAHHRPGPCDFHREDGQTVRAHARELIRCAAKRWDTKGGPALAVCIAKRESGLSPTAVGAGGKYLGLYQHARTHWNDRYGRWTWPGWDLKRTALNGRTNAIVTMRMVADHGWGAWGGTTC